MSISHAEGQAEDAHSPACPDIEAACPELVRSVLSRSVELNFSSVFVFIKVHNGFKSSYFSVYKINSQFIE